MLASARTAHGALLAKKKGGGNFLVAQIDGRWKPVLLDFGLTKASARAVKSEVIALARILLSAKSMDFTGLLSGFRELGLKVAVDDPEKMMDAMQFVFRDTAGLEDSRKQLAERSKQNREARDRAKKEAPKGTKPRRAIEAFPGVIIFFGRVLQLLRGLCVSTDSRQSYMDVMTPFAEYFLTKSVRSPASRYGLLPSIEAEPGTLADKIRRAMKELIDQEHMLGGQVAVMRHGELVAEVSGGVQGYYDPRPVRSDTVFPVFSCGKAVAAAVLHVLVREGKASYGDSVVQHWETFVSPTMADKAARDRKGRIRISHLLGHTSGLQLAGSELLGQDPAAICDWDRMVAEMERAEPGSEPGEEMAYHIVSFGWLVGGLVEKIAKRPFGDVLADTLRRLGVGEHDGYIGIPVGIEDRLANVYWDAGELRSRILAVFAQRIASQFGGSKSGVPSLERITEHLEQNPMVAQFLEKELRQGGGGGGGMAQGSMGLLAALAAARQGAASASGAATPSDEAAGGEPAQSRDILLQRMYNSAAGAASGDDPGDASKAKEDTPSAEVRDDVSSTSSSWRRAPATRPFASMGFNSAVSSPTFFNELRVRRAVIPAANGNFSALGLARFYGRLAVEAGVSRPTAPPPGASDQADASGQAAAAAEGQPDAPVLGAETVRLMRAGDEHIDPASRFGLGFTRLDWRRAPDATTDSGGSNGGGGGRSSSSSDTNETREGLPFGHAGMGGSFAFCDPASGTAVAVTVNQLSLVAPVATRDLVNLVTAHLGLGELDAFNFEGGARDETMLAPV
nr:hypothetical protein HK105_007062 [Polyrhizophydium stewartii]